MTKHTPIEKGTPRRQQGQGTSSLFERANTSFGLDGLGPKSVPSNLPEIERRVPDKVTPPVAPATGTVLNEAQSGPVAGGVAASVRNSVEPRVEPRVEFRGAKVEIDREAMRSAGLIVPEGPVTGLLEEFRIIKREILSDARASGDDAARRVLICSPHAGEGKTFCAANLAIALSAERDLQVLLIDADVIKPSITRRFGIESGPGLMDALADKHPRPEELALATDIDGLFIMAAGSSSARDTEYLASARTAELVSRLTRNAPNRFVIFDTPPALAASPAAELAAHVGQTLLVARADDTSRAALEDAQQLLSACRDIKLLLNAAHFSPSGRRFGTYYGERED